MRKLLIFVLILMPLIGMGQQVRDGDFVTMKYDPPVFEYSNEVVVVLPARDSVYYVAPVYSTVRKLVTPQHTIYTYECNTGKCGWCAKVVPAEYITYTVVVDDGRRQITLPPVKRYVNKKTLIYDGRVKEVNCSN